MRGGKRDFRFVLFRPHPELPEQFVVGVILREDSTSRFVPSLRARSAEALGGVRPYELMTYVVEQLIKESRVRFDYLPDWVGPHFHLKEALKLPDEIVGDPGAWLQRWLLPEVTS